MRAGAHRIGHHAILLITTHGFWPTALLPGEGYFGRGRLRSILCLFTPWYVPFCDVLSKLSFTIWARYASILLLRHLFTNFDSKAIVVRVAGLLGFLHLPCNFDRLLYAIALISPACFILWLFGLLFYCILILIHQIALWSLLAHCLVLEDFASRHLYLTIAALTEVYLV